MSNFVDASADYSGYTGISKNRAERKHPFEDASFLPFLWKAGD